MGGTFSSSGLFDAVGADLLDNSGFERVMRAVDGDPDTALAETLRGVVEMAAEHRGVFRILHSLAALDPGGVAGGVSRLEEGRRQGMESLARSLKEHGRLRADTAVEEAARVLEVLTAFETVDILLRDRERDRAEAVRLLVAMARRTLLADG